MKTSSAKWTKWLVVLVIAGLALVAWLILSTGREHHHSSSPEIYSCPMDPEVQQDHPGKCPICGMNLVLKKEETKTKTLKESSNSKNASDEEESEKYQCPMHPAIVQDHPGDCPVCGMKLVKMKGSASADESGSAISHRVAFYRSPMDPNQTSPVPRKDEMGMDYIPVYEEDTSGESNVNGRASIEIDPSRQQLIGLKTSKAERSEISGSWQTVGRVEVDPTRVSKINVKVPGYVERIYVDFVGQPVKRGEPLFALYSPDLLAAQQEYMLALNNRKRVDTTVSPATMYDAVLSAVKAKLVNWDVPEAAIQRLDQGDEPSKAITFVSPISGTVTVKDVLVGTELAPGALPYEITDLSTVWVMADVYQSDLPKVRVGMRASMSFSAVPDQVFTGNVAFVDPILDVQSRTTKIRIEVATENNELKPGMFGEVLLRDEKSEALTIPSDALIPTGRGFYVFVSLGDGRFEPRMIRLGKKAAERVEVIEGVSEGELVVNRANFLVDSESSLRAALSTVGSN